MRQEGIWRKRTVSLIILPCAIIIALSISFANWKTSLLNIRLGTDEAAGRSIGIFANYLIAIKPHIVGNLEVQLVGATETSDFDRNDRYLLYLPYEGTTNQFNCVIRAIYLASKLNRTLLVPPLMASRHDHNKKLTSDWRLYLNFTDFLANQKKGTLCKIVWIHEDSGSWINEMLAKNGVGCLTYGRWPHLWNLGVPAMNFVQTFGLSNLKIKWTGKDHPTWMDIFRVEDPSQLVCAANLHHMKWNMPGVSNGIEHVKMIQSLPFSDNILKAAWTFLGQHGFASNDRFGAVHWRRGDFDIACANKNHTACWPSLEALRHYMVQIHRDHQTEAMVICSNERNFLTSSYDGEPYDVILASLPYSDPSTQEWNQFAPIFMDSCLLTFSDFFLGNRYSTISQVVRHRRLHMKLHNLTSMF